MSIKAFYFRAKFRANYGNYGDELARYILQHVSKQTVEWVPHDSRQPYYLCTGSILGHNTTSKYAHVWGAGFMNYHEIASRDATYYAVRGPLTQQRLFDINIDCPDVFGDPALLMHQLYEPTVEPRYELGVVPHYVDFEFISNSCRDERIKIIDILTDDVEVTTREILECKRIVSSSLHGVIVAHSYGIPALWVKFSDLVAGKGFKFRDYFMSVGIDSYLFDFSKNLYALFTQTPYETLTKLVDSNSKLHTIRHFDFERLYRSNPFTT